MRTVKAIYEVIKRNMPSKNRLILMLINIVSVALCLLFICSACNRQLIDTTWKFDYACVYLGEEQYIFGAVDSWTDFENSDMIQVKIEGVTYFTHSSNVILSDQ